MNPIQQPNEIHPLFLVREDKISPEDGGAENQKPGDSINYPGQNWVPVGEPSGGFDPASIRNPSDSDSVWMQLLSSIRM